jgi:hypothetical protein
MIKKPIKTSHISKLTHLLRDQLRKGLQRLRDWGQDPYSLQTALHTSFFRLRSSSTIGSGALKLAGIQNRPHKLILEFRRPLCRRIKQTVKINTDGLGITFV